MSKGRYMEDIERRVSESRLSEGDKNFLLGVLRKEGNDKYLEELKEALKTDGEEALALLIAVLRVKERGDEGEISELEKFVEENK